MIGQINQIITLFKPQYNQETGKEDVSEVLMQYMDKILNFLCYLIAKKIILPKSNDFYHFLSEFLLEISKTKFFSIFREYTSVLICKKIKELNSHQRNSLGYLISIFSMNPTSEFLHFIKYFWDCVISHSTDENLIYFANFSISYFHSLFFLNKNSKSLENIEIFADLHLDLPKKYNENGRIYLYRPFILFFQFSYDKILFLFRPNCLPKQPNHPNRSHSSDSLDSLPEKDEPTARQRDRETLIHLEYSLFICAFRSLWSRFTSSLFSSFSIDLSDFLLFLIPKKLGNQENRAKESLRRSSSVSLTHTHLKNSNSSVPSPLSPSLSLSLSTSLDIQLHTSTNPLNFDFQYFFREKLMNYFLNGKYQGDLIRLICEFLDFLFDFHFLDNLIFYNQFFLAQFYSPALKQFKNRMKNAKNSENSCENHNQSSFLIYIFKNTKKFKENLKKQFSFEKEISIFFEYFVGNLPADCIFESESSINEWSIFLSEFSSLKNEIFANKNLMFHLFQGFLYFYQFSHSSNNRSNSNQEEIIFNLPNNLLLGFLRFWNLLKYSVNFSSVSFAKIFEEIEKFPGKVITKQYFKAEQLTTEELRSFNEFYIFYLMDYLCLNYFQASDQGEGEQVGKMISPASSNPFLFSENIFDIFCLYLNHFRNETGRVRENIYFSVVHCACYRIFDSILFSVSSESNFIDFLQRVLIYLIKIFPDLIFYFISIHFANESNKEGCPVDVPSHLQSIVGIISRSIPLPQYNKNYVLFSLIFFQLLQKMKETDLKEFVNSLADVSYAQHLLIICFFNFSKLIVFTSSWNSHENLFIHYNALLSAEYLYSCSHLVLNCGYQLKKKFPKLLVPTLISACKNFIGKFNYTHLIEFLEKR